MAKLFRGHPACACLIAWLPAYEAELLRRDVIEHSLDIYQLIGGAPQSGGTHTRGGAADTGQTSDEAIWVARQMGADASWHRPFNWDGHDGMEHAHLVLRGCPHNGPARYQIAAVDAGYNGLGHLGRGGHDTGPRPLSKRTWRQGIKWARAQRPDELVVIAWNVLVSNDPENVVHALEHMVETRQPDVFVLTETTRCRPELVKAGAALGYDLLQEKPVPALRGDVVHEEGDTALLVRRSGDVAVIRDRVAAMRGAWVGPKHGLDHEPRRYRRIRLRVRGRTWRLSGDHWPTKPNTKAIAETMRRTRLWLLAALIAPSVVVGDLNIHATELAAWAKKFGAKVAGRGVDLALFRRCTATATVLEAFGSDHHAVEYRLTTTKGSHR